MVVTRSPGKLVLIAKNTLEILVYEADFSKSAPLLRANRFSAALPGAMHSEECITIRNE